MAAIAEETDEFIRIVSAFWTLHSLSELQESVGFQLSVSGRDDGTLESLYVGLSEREVARTEEAETDVLLVDYAGSQP